MDVVKITAYVFFKIGEISLSIVDYWSVLRQLYDAANKVCERL